MQQSQVARAKYLDVIEKKRYEDLITAILELQLAEDPLSQANLSLQSSFIDEFE